MHYATFLVCPYSLKRLKEEETKHPWDHVNATQRSHWEWRLRNSAFLWPAYISCCVVLALTSNTQQHGLALPRLAMSHAFVPFFSRFFCHIMEDRRQVYFPWKKLHFLSHVSTPVSHTYSHSESDRIEWPFTFLPSCSLFSASLFSLFQCLESFAKNTGVQSTNPQKPNSATRNPLLSFTCLLNISFLLHPCPSQTHSSPPFFSLLLVYSSGACSATAQVLKSVWSSVRLH